MKKTTYKIVLVPIVSIFIMSIMFSCNYIYTIKSYHNKNIQDFTKSYNKEQYKKIKDDVDRIRNTISYVNKIYDETQDDLENRVLRRVNHIDMTNTPYTFILKLLDIEGGEEYAKIIFYNNKPQSVGKVISDDKKDIDNRQFLKKVVKDIKSQGYSYALYKHEKPNSKIINKKLTYFYLDKRFNWIITSSVFLDEVNEVIKQKNIVLKDQVEELIKMSLVTTIFFTFLIGLISYFISKDVSKKIKHSNDNLEIQKLRAEEAAQELKIMASKDFLTGLFNRRYFLDFADNAMCIVKRQKSNLSCLMIDIDKFKNINDCYGHSTGDIVLKSLTEVLTNGTRASDIVARFGGEEFIILLPNTDIVGAQIIAEKIRKNAEDIQLQIKGACINYTISIGVSQFKENIDILIDTIIDRADKALYDAKTSGRNRVAVDSLDSV